MTVKWLLSVTLLDLFASLDIPQMRALDLYD